MRKKKRFFIFSRQFDFLLLILVLVLMLFSSIMIVSAEMGLAVGNNDYITETIIKQSIIVAISLVAFIAASKFNFMKKSIRLYNAIFVVILFALLITKAFGSSGGSYGWIRIGGFTIQPAEFAKLFIILYAGRIYCKDQLNNIRSNYIWLISYAFIYVFIIFAWQRDFGSAAVLASITCLLLILPKSKEINKIRSWILILIGIVFVAAIILLSPFGTNILKKLSDNYQAARFLAAANPFEYQYDQGYHLIMGLVSFATGGWFGLGYGNSIHKYMNFPSPSSDFILPVIVEELGIIGFLIFLFLYSGIIFILIRHSLKTSKLSSKAIFLGTFSYIVVHFILNVGGVSGLIPLTGVPLLIVSYGGTSTLATLIALGICESEIINNRKEYLNESSSR